MKQFLGLSDKIEGLLQTVSKSDIDSLPDEDPDGRCEKCNGFGFVKTPKGVVPCECARRDVAAFEIEKARIPSRYEYSTLDTFELYPDVRDVVNKAKTFVKNYSQRSYGGLFIYGSTGSGKTHIAVGILKALIEQGFDGVFYNIVDLLDEIRSTYDPNNPVNPKSRLEQDMKRQVIVLDDFGVQKTSAWVADRLYAIINRRYQDCKTLIITSNYKLDDLKVKIDDRIYSRMNEMLDPIEFKSNDFRRRKKMRDTI